MNYFTFLTATTVLLAVTKETLSSCAGKILMGKQGVSDQDKKLILDMHNKARQALAMGMINGQPPAANMQEMKWDDELAYKAQRWALTCTNQHDQQRHIARFRVGQNIASRWTTKHPENYLDTAPDFADAITRWYNEVQRYHFAQIRRSGRQPVTGHYTQMIWANTNLIGCGYSYYHDPSKGFTKDYVCNYGPGGNVLTLTPYETGYPSCSSFGLENSPKYNGLCDKSTVRTNIQSNIHTVSTSYHHQSYQRTYHPLLSISRTFFH